MYLRFVRIKSSEEPLRRFYAEQVLTTLEHVEGCLFAGLLRSSTTPGDFLSVTLWRQRQHAERYERSGEYDGLLDGFEEFLEGTRTESTSPSTVVPVPDPPVETYTVELAKGVDALLADHGARAPHARVVSMQIAGGEFDAFRQHYEHDVIPVLEAAPGCRAALLVEGERNRLRALSVTLWESEARARAYESSGAFERLMGSLADHLSPLYGWGAQESPGESRRESSGLHLDISHYDMILVQRFRL